MSIPFRHFSIICFLFAFSALSARELVDDRGVAVGPAPARRLVSLSPALTEIVFAVGAGELLVGRTDWCDWPPETADIASVGGFSGATISLETIRALKADTVVLSSFMHGRLVSPLERAGIRVIALDPGSIDAMLDALNLIAALCGREEEGTRVRASLEAELALLDAAMEAHPADTIPSVFYLLQDEPLMTAGKESFVCELIERAGGVNIFADIDQAWPLVSPESLFVRSPRFVVCDSETALRVFGPTGRSPLRRLTAARDRRVIVIDPALLSRPGPRLVEAVRLLARELGTLP